MHSCCRTLRGIATSAGSSGADTACHSDSQRAWWAAAVAAAQTRAHGSRCLGNKLPVSQTVMQQGSARKRRARAAALSNNSASAGNNSAVTKMAPFGRLIMVRDSAKRARRLAQRERCCRMQCNHRQRSARAGGLMALPLLPLPLLLFERSPRLHAQPLLRDCVAGV
eukprot:TRINITY_DN27089_c0_g1_i1.p1 TRINITY_DN27089_c0_g1~~TRINITY_DN27089_c0_g1_i1.p1  ORF type:complete len:167 (+),score=41.15 TRINITY_DN27089_c0_g1_i1:100-600(+)